MYAELLKLSATFCRSEFYDSFPGDSPGTQIEGQRFSSEIAVRSPSSLALVATLRPFNFLAASFPPSISSLHRTAPYCISLQLASLRLASPHLAGPSFAPSSFVALLVLVLVVLSVRFRSASQAARSPLQIRAFPCISRHPSARELARSHPTASEYLYGDPLTFKVYANPPRRAHVERGSLCNLRFHQNIDFVIRHGAILGVIVCETIEREREVLFS